MQYQSRTPFTTAIGLTLFWSSSLLLELVASSAAIADELRFDAAALLARSVSRNVRLSNGGAAVELERGVLIEDDGPAAGYSYRPNEERLSEHVRIKKELLITDPRAGGATLLVGQGGDLQFLVNGRPQALQRLGKADNYWEAYALPPEFLKAGKNDIVLFGAGKVWIARSDEFAAGSRTRTEHPNRSAKSTDAGRTWNYERLGTNDDIDGEYYVRLFLDQYRPEGSLLLPVLDAGNLNGREMAPPLASLGPIRIAVKAEGGNDGRIRIRMRSGSTPVPTARRTEGDEPEGSWSDWQELDGDVGVLTKPAGRYFQAALEFQTSNPLSTPKLQHVTIETHPKPSDADWTDKLTISESRNEEIVRTSIPFEYEPFDHPRLKVFRERFNLDEVVAGAESEFELITRLAAWSSQRWAKGHLQQIYPAWDALEILEPHADGQPVGGFCQQYNVVFLQACESFGLVGRAVSIGPGRLGRQLSRGGHEVVEIWSNEYRKWVYVDGNTAWYAVDEKTRVPLSLWELRARQLAALADSAHPRVEIVKLAETRFQWDDLKGWPPFVELRMIPRSNFLEQRTPLPLNQGMRGWFWTGHYVWTDAAIPAALLYGNRVTHRRNWEWTLNQAHFTLEATDRPGELLVHLDTETPGFQSFLADIDRTGRKPVSSPFLWKLHPGTNRLEVRPRNTAGREGIPSSAVLDFQ